MHPAIRMALQRTVVGVGVLFVVSVIIFGAVELLPGDLAEELLGRSATEETVEALREELGLNDPAPVRYFNWLGGVLTGDLGRSIATDREISELIGDRLGFTFFLAGYAAAIAVPLALTLGILTALFRNTWFDRLANIFTLTSISFPEFFIAYILILFFSVLYPVFPSIADLGANATFADMVYRTFLPALTLTLVITAHMMRMTRAAIINLLASPYIEMANLKGLSPIRIVVRHALPNALAPVINVVALNLAYLVTGVVVVEVVFVYPGLGQLFVDSVSRRDFPVVQACCADLCGGVHLARGGICWRTFCPKMVTNPRLLHRR